MVMVDINTRLYKFTQGSQVTDTLYYEQFKSLVEVIEHYQGEIGHHPKLILQELEVLAKDKFDPETPLTSIAAMEPTILQAATENARQKYLSCLFLNGANKSRYESLVYGIMNDYVKGLDTYPKTLQDAFALLTETRCRRVTKSVLEGSSFAQGQGEGEDSHLHVRVAKRKALSSVSALSRPAWKDGERNKKKELQMEWG